MTQPIDPAAPHGRDGNGTPLAPYGLNVDGSPRKSNRGARAGQKGRGAAGKGKPAGPQVSVSNLNDDDRRGMLCELADMALVTPLASASQTPFLINRIGARQTDALAGDAFILSQYMPGIAEGLILLSKTKPRTLAWLDKAEQNAPYILLTKAIMDAAKAVAENHFRPNPNVAAAGRSLAAIRMAQMAEAVNAQAAAMSATLRRPEPVPEPATSEMTADDFERAGYNRASEFAA